MSYWRIPKRQHDPQQTETFEFDWTKYLGTGNTISSVELWTVEAGITKVSSSNTTTSTFITLKGGTIGEIYRVSCRIITSDGRKPERSMDIVVQAM